jgi:hypothetical protein
VGVGEALACGESRKETVMKLKRFVVAAFLAGTMMVTAAGSVGAAQSLPDGCSKYHGTITCTQTPGNSPMKNGNNHFTSTSQGNLKNKQECFGPPGQCR